MSSGISNISMNSVLPSLKKAANEYGHFVFGTYSDDMGKSLALKFKDKASTDGFFKKVAEAYKEANPNRDTNIFKKMFEEAKALPGEVSAAAKTAKGTWGAIKAGSKEVFKKLPLVGNIAIVAFEIPNVYNAFKNGGAVDGTIETAKAAGKIGIFAGGAAAGATAGSMICPGLGTLLGGLVGGIIASFTGDALLGKSFTEKQAAATELTSKINVQQPPNNLFVKNGVPQPSAQAVEHNPAKYNKYGIPFAPGFNG